MIFNKWYGYKLPRLFTRQKPEGFFCSSASCWLEVLGGEKTFFSRKKSIVRTGSKTGKPAEGPNEKASLVNYSKRCWKSWTKFLGGRKENTNKLFYISFFPNKEELQYEEYPLPKLAIWIKNFRYVQKSLRSGACGRFFMFSNRCRPFFCWTRYYLRMSPILHVSLFVLSFSFSSSVMESLGVLWLMQSWQTTRQAIRNTDRQTDRQTDTSTICLHCVTDETS